MNVRPDMSELNTEITFFLPSFDLNYSQNSDLSVVHQVLLFFFFCMNVEYCVGLKVMFLKICNCLVKKRILKICAWS